MIVELNHKLEASNIQAGTGITVNSSGNNVIISLSWSVSPPSNTWALLPPPFISSNPVIIPTSTTKDVTIQGDYFLPTTSVSIPSWDGTINSINISSPHNITLNLTSGTTEANYNLILSNGVSTNTQWTGNGVNYIEVRNWLTLSAFYNIASNATSETQFINDILASYPEAELAIRPRTGNVAELLNVTANTGNSIALWEISTWPRFTPAHSVMIAYFADWNFSFAIELKKTDGSTTTIDEFTDNIATSYDYEVIHNNVNYTNSTNYNYSNSTRRWWVWQLHSTDDGWFGFAPWNIDFNTPWPFINSSSSSWGFWNINSSDTSANSLFINGNGNPWVITAAVFIIRQ